MRAPGQPASVARASPRRVSNTVVAISRSAFQPLQICLVSVGSSRPESQLTSSGEMPVSKSPQNSRSNRSLKGSISSGSISEPTVTKPSALNDATSPAVSIAPTYPRARRLPEVMGGPMAESLGIDVGEEEHQCLVNSITITS